MTEVTFLYNVLEVCLEYQINLVGIDQKYQFEIFLNQIGEARDKGNLKELKRFYKFLYIPMMKDSNLQKKLLDKIGFIPPKKYDVEISVEEVLRRQNINTENEYKTLLRTVENCIADSNCSEERIDAINNLLNDYELKM